MIRLYHYEVFNTMSYTCCSKLFYMFNMLYKGCYNVKLRPTIEMFPFNLKASGMKVPIPTLYPVEKQHHNSCWPSVGAFECRLVL